MASAMAAMPTVATAFLNWDRTHSASMISLRVRGPWFVPTALTSLVLALTGCRHKAQLSDLTEEFTYTALSFSPSAATAAGLHEYKDQRLDGQLDDMGPAAVDHQTRFYRDFSQRLHQFDPDKL